MFVKNVWYVAAWSHEIEPGKLLARTLLGEPVVLYRGMAKNANRLFVTCALANLYMVRRTLLLQQDRCAR